MKWASIALIAIVVVSVTNIPVLAQDHEWWVLHPGAWKWYVDALDSTKELNIEVSDGAPGMTNLDFGWYQNNALIRSSVLLLSVDATGDYWWHATDGQYFAEHDNHSIHHPILIVDEPLWVGKAWSDTIYQPGWDIDLLYELECVAETELIVPSGIYNTFEIRYEVHYGMNWGFHYIERKWHCDGVGMVKFIVEDFPWAPEINGEFVLASFHIPEPVDVGIAPTPRTSIHNHPNPFNPQTTITFGLDQPRRAEIAVYDLTGRLLGVLANRTYAAGHHSLVWNGKDAMGRAVPSGTYIVRLETGSGVETRRVMLLR